MVYDLEEFDEKLSIPIFELLMCFSDALDLISPLVSGHQIRVTYLSLKIGKQINLSKEQLNNLVIAASIHDIGATTVKERNEIISPNFESDGRHEAVGYSYVNKSEIFKNAANIIRYHHKDWNNGTNGNNIPLESYIISLADRIETYIDKKRNVLNQIDEIVKAVNDKRNEKFMPELVDAFNILSKNESFWLYTVAPNVADIIRKEADLPEMNLDIDGLYDISNWFSNIIDFRSRFTSVHSKGVAISAKMIAKVMGKSDKYQKIMEISGFLHDLGKLAVPNSILNKPDRLDKSEYEIIRGHTFHTYNVLSRIKNFDVINKYASYHHEKLDSTGYPFHIGADKMPLGSRIMAVADIFTAITEDRPYRIGMPKEQVIKILDNMGDDKTLDSFVVKSLIENYDEINSIRKTVQDNAQLEYDNFWNSIN